MAHTKLLAAEDRPAFRLGDPLNDVIRVELAPAEAPAPSLPMLWPSNVEAIEQAHALSHAPPALDYYVARNASLAGGGAQPTIQGSYIFSPTILPNYVPHFIEGGLGEDFWSPPPSTRAVTLKAGISIIHYNLVFGHWLLEMFPKLLMLRSLPEFKLAPIILPSTAPSYVAKTIRQVLPGWPIIIYDRFKEHVEVNALILPGMYHEAYFFHSDFNRAIEAHLRWAQRTWRHGASVLNNRLLNTKSDGRYLFVSRRRVVSSFRELTNVETLERVAKEMGFKVISPERMSWREQVSTFSRAEVIAGEFGSGMHNTLFSPEGARVVCLNWIVDTQSRICNFRRQHVGYVMPPDGQPRLFSLDGRFTKYEIDPDHLRAALAKSLERIG